MRYHLFRIIVFAGLWSNSFFALAQFDQERFGKNRIQNQQFEWYYYSSNNFEVYYYDRGGANAKMAIDYLESEFNRLTQMIGYVAYTKPKIYIYNSPEELLQSNINLNKEEYNEQGQTNFNRLLAEVAYKGEVDLFKQDLIYGITKVIIEEMLYGSSVSDAFQSNLTNSFPEWYVDGIALYLAKGWSREMDDFVRHYIQEDQNPKILKLKEKEAALVGQSVWNYIAERYGRRYISSILNLSRINRNEENSIANTVGLNYKTFAEDWKKYYLDVNKKVSSTFKVPDRDAAVAETSPRFIGAINDIKFSPDGLNLAYVINNGGKYKVQVRDVSSGREQTIFAGGTALQDQEANFRSPIIAWRDSANIAIASFKRGFTTLRLRSLDGSNQDKIFLRNITQILSLDFNSTGKNMVLSAISNGKSDIYTLNARGAGKRLTNDSFDELTPVFLNDSTIIYSSNATNLPDSVMGKNLELASLPNYYNLYMVQVTDTIVTKQLTNSNSKNIRPRKVNNNTIVYLSDLSGINNLMRMSIGNQVSNQISAFNKSLEAFDVNSRMNRMAYSVRDGRESYLVVEGFSNSDQFTPSTPRVQLEQAKNLNERMAARRRLEDKEAKENPPQVTPEPNPTIQPLIKLDTTAKKSTSSIDLKRLSFESKNGINTDNYTFDNLPNNLNTTEATVSESKANLLETFRKQSLKKRVVGPKQMEPQFFINNINTRFVVDPLRGFGIGLTGKMTDLLDNHAFHGGLMTTLDFKSGGDLFFEYEYLKSRVDFKGRFDRKTILVDDQGDITDQKYVLTKVEAGLSYPLNANSKVSLSPFVAKTQYFNLNSDSLINGQNPDQNRLDVNYVGGRAEFVYDRTQPLGLYSQTGFKGKIGYVQYQSFGNKERSFSNFYLDLREYRTIHKNIVLAARLYAGSFMGNNPQTYIVGGMDNWLFNEFYRPPSNRPESSPIRNPSGVENSNILFADFVDLRGYDYDEIRGRNMVTFTAELRIPVFSYLTRGNITSNFIRNFQLIGFYDVGSAWNDSAPWERVNDQNTEVINTEGSPFTIVLNNFNNPWLQSYGAGLRTVLLNYYVKFDVARPIRNYESEDLRFYVTLGFNF